MFYAALMVAIIKLQFVIKWSAISYLTAKQFDITMLQFMNNFYTNIKLIQVSSGTYLALTIVLNVSIEP